jgi:3-phenylpropionate/cinnamic acid dioxygenase small subunit
MTEEAASLAIATDILYREARCLDERRWDDWLALYDEAAEFWVPAWKSEGDPTADPMTEVSLFYTATRSELEDRVRRVRSGKSIASTPLPRTTHIVSNVRPFEPFAADRLRLRSNWVSHVFFPRSEESHAFFGHTEHTLVASGNVWLIARKRIVLQNDYIPTMLDIYCV